VLALHEAATDLAATEEKERPGRVERVAENGPGLAFRDVSLVSTTGELLVARFAAEVSPGERVLVDATPPAAAALFRAVAGLSSWGSGRIEFPEGVVPFFMGERPYLSKATLAEILADPRQTADFSRAELTSVLVEVGLTPLIPALGTTAPWEQELSLEDQQRLGIARALLHSPAWLFIHDATSALNEADEAKLMNTLVTRLPHTTIVTITHRSVIDRFHQRHIALTRAA
jgi:putative ATP-binding cassette transporter